MKLHWIAAMVILILFPLTGCIDNGQETTYDIDIGYISVWEGVTTEEYPTSFGDFTHHMFSKHDLLLISSSDDDHKITQSQETEQVDGYPYNFYICSINKTINSIRIQWEGYASQPFMGNAEQKLDIYIWNVDELKWDKIISQKWEGNDEMDKILKKDIQNVTNYISDKNTLYILIIGPFGAGNSTATLATDFIEIKGA
ncbi:MAG: hypothetical protein JSW00_09030 [Thermoplasmata archaeon]|nr:MAG: hypothetical protein JSW00_09030 [Thermoplasmata archaeon]